jgi:hypothetical protein
MAGILFATMFPTGVLRLRRSFAILYNELSLIFNFSVLSCRILFLCICVLMTLVIFFICSLTVCSNSFISCSSIVCLNLVQSVFCFCLALVSSHDYYTVVLKSCLSSSRENLLSGLLYAALFANLIINVSTLFCALFLIVLSAMSRLMIMATPLARVFCRPVPSIVTTSVGGPRRRRFFSGTLELRNQGDSRPGRVLFLLRSEQSFLLQGVEMALKRAREW